MAELPEEVLEVMKRKWAEMKEEEQPTKKLIMRGPDVKTVIVIGVASISGFVEIVESLGTLF